MLGALARWLRAAGYDSSWKADVGDWELVRLAQREGRILLTSDSGILRIGIVRDGEVPGLFIPHGLGKQEQLAFVLRRLNLPMCEPRCMACGGQLAEMPKERLRDRVPPRTFAWLEHFYECVRCGQLFWQGTHWQRVASELDRARIIGQQNDS
jgi:uncharacterized protein with PIN domain